MNKSIKILSLSILFLVVIMSAVSALDLTATDNEFSQSDGDSLTISVSDVTGDVEFSFNEVKDYDDKEVTFSTDPIILSSADGDIEITTTVPAEFDFFGKQYSTTLTATDDMSTLDDSDDITKTLTLIFEQTPFCKWDNGIEEDENNDHIELQIKDISVINGFGEDEEWYPQDEIEVEIKVENQNSDDDIDDIVIEWGIFDKDSGEWVIDVDDEKDFNLKDGDEETKIITFKLDDLDEDFDELGDLVFYARAIGDDDSVGDVCSSDSENVRIITDDEFVILDNIEITGTASCGEEIQITADVWNLGDEDQEDIDVVIYNKELGINKKVAIGDIDSFDNEKLDITITLLDDADEKQYDLIFSVYDEDGEMYENDNDDKAEFFVPIIIEQGSCAPSASVYATLESEAIAGKELTIKAVVTNTGDKASTYTFNIANYNWATLESVEPTTIILNSGESKDVLIKFNVNSDVSGDKSFDIELLSDGKVALTQPVSVTIEESTGFDFGGITGNIISGSNWYLWGIGALNVLLVVIIIIVAFRVSKKSE